MNGILRAFTLGMLLVSTAAAAQSSSSVQHMRFTGRKEIRRFDCDCHSNQSCV